MAFLVFCRLNYMLNQATLYIVLILWNCVQNQSNFTMQSCIVRKVWPFDHRLFCTVLAYLMQCSHQTVYDFALSTINTRGLNFKKDLQILLSGMLIKRRKNEPKSMLRTQEGIGSRPMLKQILCGTLKNVTIFMKTFKNLRHSCMEI